MGSIPISEDDIVQLAIRYMNIVDRDWVYRAPETFFLGDKVWWALANKKPVLASEYMAELEELASRRRNPKI